MTNPTSNFGWQMPTPTDLVTDLPADFEVFGQAVDTTMADLKGGTSGQILSKASNTDMDFTWITNDVGDITAVTVSSPLTGGGTSGSVSVGILNGTTSNLGAVQLSDSTSSTSTTLAATANAVKTSYDLANTANTTANAAIPATTVTTAGDIIYRNSTVPTRLGIGTAGQVLTVNSGATAPEWKTISGGGKVLQVVQATYSTATTVAATSFTDTGLSVTITPSSATSKILIIGSQSLFLQRNAKAIGGGLQLVRGSTSIMDQTGSGSGGVFIEGTGLTDCYLGSVNPINYLDSPATTSATTYKVQAKVYITTNGGSVVCQYGGIVSTLLALEIGA